MLPDTGTACYISTCWIPLNLRDAIMVGSIHMLQICREVFLRFRLFTFVVEIPKIKIGALLGQKCSYDDKSSLGRPVDGIAVFPIYRADMFEVSDRCPFGFLGTEEGHGSFGWYSRGDKRCFGGGDKDKPIAFRFPREVDDGIFDRIDDLDWDTLFPNAEDLEVGGQRLFGFRMAIDFYTDICCL